MAQADSGRAIGAVTNLLALQLLSLGFLVHVGRPESGASATGGPRLNLFLYEARFDASLRNVALHADAEPPLWLVLKYLLTAFDGADFSDSLQAHELLGQALAALQSLSFLTLEGNLKSDIRTALERNPEPLKITFDDAPVDLVSKIMQGSDETYRFSMAFEVRPVMILPGTTPAMAPLVGVDSSSPPAIIVGDGVGLTVLPSLGPSLAQLAPYAFEPGDEIGVVGDDLQIAGLECWLGPVQLVIVARRPDRLSVRIEGDVQPPAIEGPVQGGTAISAGEHAIVVRAPIGGHRTRSSNLLIARVRPVVTTAHVLGGVLTIHGVLLGTWEDDVLVALRRDGAILRMFEPEPKPTPPTLPKPLTVVAGDAQQALTVEGLTDPTRGVAAGDYQVVVRVNGQQARLNPTVTVA